MLNEPQPPRARRAARAGVLRALVVAAVVAVGITGCTTTTSTTSTTSVDGRAAGSTTRPSTTATPSQASARPSVPASTERAATPSASPRPTLAPSSAATTAAARTALALLAKLPVKGRAPATGYARTADFGTAWIDVDHNGCDTRNDILGRDLTGTVMSGSCEVTTGTLVSPYTGATIHFVRGIRTSTEVQIDHLVSLENAWVTGAQQLPQTSREALANDPENLLAVDEHSNEQKGSGDAATWLPARTSFRCTYIEHQVTVKAKYSLWVTSAEHAAMVRILSACPGGAGSTAGSSSSTGSAPDSVAPVAPSHAASGGSTYYANCDAVRAAGAAPIRVGQPGYSRSLDRDGDGVGCE